MNHYLEQAIHNKQFLDSIESEFKERFFDWKITVNFYIAIHLLKALAYKRKKDIGDTHHDIFNSLDRARCATPKMQIPPEMWKKYKRIFSYSKNSRYDGIPDPTIYELAIRNDYIEVCKLQAAFCSYMKAEGLSLEAA